MKIIKQKDRNKDILFILASSFIVVVAWIGFNIFHIYVTSTVSEEVQSQLEPIDGNFDTITLQQLKTRQRVNPAFERRGATEKTPTPTLSPEPTPEQEQTATESSRFAPTDTPVGRTGQ